MPWEVLISISILVFALNSLFTRSIMKQGSSDPYAQIVILFGLGGLYSAIIAVSLGKLQFPTQVQWFYLLLGGLVATIGAILVNKAYKLIEASEVGILSSSQKLWSVMGTFIFLGEAFSFAKIAATMIIIGGVVIASWKHHTLKWDKGALFVIIGAMLWSVADISAYRALGTLDIYTFTVLGYLVPVVMVLIYRPSTIKHLKFYARGGNFLKITMQSVFDVIGTFCFFYAYSLAHNASTLTPLTTVRVLLTIILGAIFLKERDNLMKKIIGGLIIIFGSALLFI